MINYGKLYQNQVIKHTYYFHIKIVKQYKRYHKVYNKNNLLKKLKILSSWIVLGFRLIYLFKKWLLKDITISLELRDINLFIGDIIIIMIRHYALLKLLLSLWDNIRNYNWEKLSNNQNQSNNKNQSNSSKQHQSNSSNKNQ